MGTDEVKINKKDADVIAKLRFGTAAFAIRVSSNDRNQRFGIMLVDNGSVFALGHGDSFNSALNMAEMEVKAARLQVEKNLKEAELEQTEVKPEVK